MVEFDGEVFEWEILEGAGHVLRMIHVSALITQNVGGAFVVTITTLRDESMTMDIELEAVASFEEAQSLAQIRLFEERMRIRSLYGT